MLRFSIAQMRASIGRLVAAGIAIVLGTGFVTAALLASDVLRATAEATIVGELNGADVVAQVQPFTDDDIRAIEALPGVAGVDPQWVQGMPLTANHTSQYAEIQSLPQYGQAPPLGDGALPSGDGQIMVSEQFAEALGVGIGEQLRWSDFMSELEGTLTITAISGEGALLLTDAPVWSTLNTVRMLQELRDFQPISPAELLIFGDGTRTQDELVAAIEAVDDGLGLTSAQAIIDIRVEDMAGNSQFFVYFGLAFAAVAVIVAGMVITNTFEVLVAQRTKVLALMRCGGATKGQVLRSVLNEALLLGLLASVGGVLLGLALGQGAVWFLGTRLAGVAVPTLTDIDPATLVAPIIVGVVMTLVAAFGPARASTRVPPVAALRPQAIDPVRGGGRWRLAIGILMMAVGLALLVGPPVALRMSVENDVSTLADYVGLLLAVGIAGGLLTVAGYLVLSVFIVPRIVRLLGAIVALPLPKEAAATARLATANAVRNPRRTAATTSALVIGVGLVVMMATGAATARATLSS
ncbi:MAG: FtsX-like permease family protein, partial [Propionibacterium sp.]|nr:FtsX-like permease family protein [Propionibacterium sp.]